MWLQPKLTFESFIAVHQGYFHAWHLKTYLDLANLKKKQGKIIDFHNTNFQIWQIKKIKSHPVNLLTYLGPFFLLATVVKVYIVHLAMRC
jgi:hypothetical protein